MRLLVLGGTHFVGRAIVEEASGRGWDVTIFHRGRSRAPQGVEVLLGDRRTPDGLVALTTGAWDAVVDTWSGPPSAVRDAAAVLAGRVHRYTYISSRSVYAAPFAPGRDETAPVVDGSPNDDNDADYARAKRGAELAASRVFGDRTLLVRAGLILGPYEDVFRLPWWLRRIAAGGPVLAPGPRAHPLQYVDVRDLATWTLDATAGGRRGAYDIVSPSGHTTMEELLRTCVSVTGADAELRWTDPDQILAAGVRPWVDLPIWLPPGEDHDAMQRSDVSKALRAGLRCRPIAETVADTWDWIRGLDGDPPRRPDRSATGIDPDTEARLLGLRRPQRPAPTQFAEASSVRPSGAGRASDSSVRA